MIVRARRYHEIAGGRVGTHVHELPYGPRRVDNRSAGGVGVEGGKRLQRAAAVGVRCEREDVGRLRREARDRSCNCAMSMAAWWCGIMSVMNCRSTASFGVIVISALMRSMIWCMPAAYCDSVPREAGAAAMANEPRLQAAIMPPATPRACFVAMIFGFMFSLSFDWWQRSVHTPRG
jgi:hypothetical protein